MVHADGNAIEGLEALKRVWLQETQDECGTLAAQIEAGRGSAEEIGSEVYRLFHDLQGQAALFGYPLLASMAQGFCVYWRSAEGEVGPERLPVMLAHLDAARLVLESKLEGQGGATGRAMLAELEAVAGH